MKFHKHILAAVAVIAIGAAGTGAYLLNDDEARHTVAAKAEQLGVLPAPFQADTVGGYTPGDDFTKYATAGTPTGSMDAYRLLERCQSQRQLDPGKTNPELLNACDGITEEMMQRGPTLLAEALVKGQMPEAATEMFWLLYPLPSDKLAEARKDPTMVQAFGAMVDTLRDAASHDKSAITALALLYTRDGIVERNPMQALTYVVALQALNPGDPRMQGSRDKAVADLAKELTPEQTRAAREAGLALARNCNCQG